MIRQDEGFSYNKDQYKWFCCDERRCLGRMTRTACDERTRHPMG